MLNNFLKLNKVELHKIYNFLRSVMLIRRTEPHLHITFWCICRFFEIKINIYYELNKKITYTPCYVLVKK